MSDPQRILIHLDPDPQPSVFDRVVAVDAGVQQLFSHSSVSLEQVESLVHGAIFTRGVDQLKHTAIFVGGANVAAGEAVLARVLGTFFGPMRVSVMLDSNGSNTTAAAAVLAAGRHTPLRDARVMVLGGTGPVGQRVCRLLGLEGASVVLASRFMQRAQDAARVVNEALKAQVVTAFESHDDQALVGAMRGVSVLVAAGAAGVQLISRDRFEHCDALRVAIDLNAVPPLGIEGVNVTDKAQEHLGVVCYGAIGVGGTKMKIHKAAIRSLFTRNDLVLDAQAIHELGKTL